MYPDKDSKVELRGIENVDLEDDKEIISVHGDETKQKLEAPLNPLAGVSRQELLDQVARFSRKYGLEDIEGLLEKGALVAQDPHNYEDLPELDPSEIQALNFEKEHKWRQPLQLYLTVVLCSLGACVQGWDQTGSSGANLSFPKEFGIPITDPTIKDYQKNNWIVGIVNSAPYMGAFAFSCWLTDPVNNLIGRRGTIFVAALICIAAPILSAFTHSWWQLFLCRIFLGFGVGFKETSAPVLAAENAPAPIRGALVMSWQMWTAFGIFLGYAANLVVYKVGPIAWRLQLASAFIPAVPLALLVYLVPESPRWYIKRGKIRKAWNSLLRLRKSEIQAARDLFYINTQVEIERAEIGNSSFFTRVGELFYKNRLRQAALACFAVMMGHQMCGINIIAFFSSSIFAEVNPGHTAQAMWASFGFGLVNFVFAIPAFFTIDTFGRRSLLLFTFPQMFWTLLAAGLSYLASNPRVKLPLVSLFIYLFTAFYSPGAGPVPFVYCAEVFPLSHREIGMAYSVIINNFFATVLSLTFFRMKVAMTVTGAFGFYAGLNLLALSWIFLWVPETKQKTLEELDQVFSIPTSEFMRLQIHDLLGRLHCGRRRESRQLTAVYEHEKV